jgi:hypothetical protein
MNTYPRRSLGGLTPIEKFKQMNGENFKLPSFIETKDIIDE